MSFSEFKGLAIGSSGRWTTLGPLKFYSKTIWSSIQVPAGFSTDLASIPRVFLPIFGKNGNHRMPAILHDFLYSRGGKVATSSGVKILSRSKCDKIFLEAMKSCGVSLWKRSMMYQGVRVGGWVSFKND